MADTLFATITTEEYRWTQQAGWQVLTDGPRSICALKVLKST